MWNVRSMTSILVKLTIAFTVIVFLRYAYIEANFRGDPAASNSVISPTPTPHTEPTHSPTVLPERKLYPECFAENMLQCFELNDHKCVWCAADQWCIPHDALHECKGHWCKGQMFVYTPIEHYQGTYNQMLNLLAAVFISRSAHGFIRLPTFLETRVTTGGTAKVIFTDAVNTEYLLENLKHEMCGIPYYQPSNAKWSRFNESFVTPTDGIIGFHSGSKYMETVLEKNKDYDIVNLGDCFARYKIVTPEDNNFALLFWKYFHPSNLVESVAQDIKKNKLHISDYLGIHLRIESDWQAWSRGFPPPDVLVEHMKKYKESGDVYIASGIPMDADAAVPYRDALQNASYRIVVKPDLTPYFGSNATYSDFVSLIDFSILVGARATFGLKFSTFFVASTLIRSVRLNNNQSTYLDPDLSKPLQYAGWADDDMWWGMLEFNQTMVEKWL